VKKSDAHREPFSNLDTITTLFIVATLVAVVFPDVTNFARKHEARQQAVECRENVRRIADAVDDYYDRRKSVYPGQVNALIPKYLEELPRCPAAGENEREIYVYQVDMHEVNYTIYCNGQRHQEADLGKNEPRYSAARRWSSQSKDL